MFEMATSAFGVDLSTERWAPFERHDRYVANRSLIDVGQIMDGLQTVRTCGRTRTHIRHRALGSMPPGSLASAGLAWPNESVRAWLAGEQLSVSARSRPKVSEPELLSGVGEARRGRWAN